MKVNANNEENVKKRKYGFIEAQDVYERKSPRKKERRRKGNKSRKLEVGGPVWEPALESEANRKRLRVGKEELLAAIEVSDLEEEVLELPSALPLTQPPMVKPEHKRIENLTPEQDQRIREIYREQHRIIRNAPLLRLYDGGEEASLKLPEELRYPLVFPDIEEVLTHLQYNRHLTRWLHLKRATKLNNTVVLSVEGPGLEDYMSQIEDCPTLNSFRIGVEFVSPLSYGDCVEHSFASKLHIKPPPEASIKEGFQNMKSCPKRDGFIVGLDSLFNIKWDENEANRLKNDKDLNRPEKDLDHFRLSADYDGLSDYESEECLRHCTRTGQVLPISLNRNDNFSRLDLLLNPRDMAYQKYPLPFIPRYRSFVKTKKEYKEITEKSPMFGLDCEMCETKAGSELTRISLVNEMHEVVYEKLVKPDNKITNYLTKFSGITAKMLGPVRTRLEDVQEELRTILPPDAILVGQSLNCDLVAMKMMHPYIIDTSLIFNLSGVRQCKSKLKTLCAEFLSERIQSGRKGHDSVEDALAAMKLVQAKLSHSLEWGDAVLGYKRTEEESRQANLDLLKKEKEFSEGGVKARLTRAINSLVDDPDLFLDPPFKSPQDPKRDNLPQLNMGGEHKETSFDQQDIIKMGAEESENVLSELNSCDVKEKKIQPNVPPSNYIYSEVAVVGSKEVKKLYKSKLPESTEERVKFFKAKSPKEVIGKVLELNALKDKKRLILAHLKSPCVCQVEKWSSQLTSSTSDNDLLCVLLCGKEGSHQVRGAFFASLPFIDRLPTVKQVVQRYLESCGYKGPVPGQLAS